MGSLYAILALVSKLSLTDSALSFIGRKLSGYVKSLLMLAICWPSTLLTISGSCCSMEDG